MIGWKQWIERKRKQRQMDEYIKKYNPYEVKQSLKFDLKAYASYVKNNHLPQIEITGKLLDKFKL